jgi:hypothetical protein
MKQYKTRVRRMRPERPCPVHATQTGQEDGS